MSAPQHGVRPISHETVVSANALVRDAINRIEPLPFSSGPNLYTVDVGGWGLSAPTRPQLSKMLWDWFNGDRPVMVEVWDQIGDRISGDLA